MYTIFIFQIYSILEENNNVVIKLKKILIYKWYDQVFSNKMFD